MLAGFDGTVGEDHIYNLGIIRRTFNCPQLERYNPRKWDLFYKPPDNRQKAFQYVYPKDNTAIYLVIGIALLALLLVSCIIFLVCSKNKKKGNIKPNVQDALEDDKLNQNKRKTIVNECEMSFDNTVLTDQNLLAENDKSRNNHSMEKSTREESEIFIEENEFIIEKPYLEAQTAIEIQKQCSLDIISRPAHYAYFSELKLYEFQPFEFIQQPDLEPVCSEELIYERSQDINAVSALDAYFSEIDLEQSESDEEVYDMPKIRIVKKQKLSQPEIIALKKEISVKKPKIEEVKENPIRKVDEIRQVLQHLNNTKLSSLTETDKKFIKNIQSMHKKDKDTYGGLEKELARYHQIYPSAYEDGLVRSFEDSIKQRKSPVKPKKEFVQRGFMMNLTSDPKDLHKSEQTKFDV